MKRMSTIFRAKANKALDEAEDPRETLDYSYEQQLEMLRRYAAASPTWRPAASGSSCSATSCRRSRTSSRAGPAGAGDGPRGPRPRGADPQVRRQQQIGDLDAQHAQLQGEEEKLTLASQRLQAKVESFRTRKETIKATYTAAEAQTRISEAFSGISEEMGDVGLAVQRAEDKTQQMQARAGAVDELIASGALDDASSITAATTSPRARADELPGRRRGRAGHAQGRSPGAIEAPETPAIEDAGPGHGDPARLSAGREGAAGMIVRILGEGQFEVADDQLETLNELDRAVESTIESGDEAGFRAALAALLDGVRRTGTPLADDSLEDSDLILPPPDATIDEVRDLLEGDGLIPG